MPVAPDDLWNEVRECFIADDETQLPTVELRELTVDDVGSVYLRIRAQSQMATEAPTFWHSVEDRDVPLDDVKNAAELVTSGTAPSLSFAVNPATKDSAPLPTISVEVFEDSIALSYSTGDSWDADRVYAFFSWLESLLKQTESGMLAVDEIDGPYNYLSFLKAWEHFTANSGEH